MRFATLSVCALSLLSVGCDDVEWGDHSSRFTEDFSYSYTLKPGGRLSIESFNGSIEITGWDRDTVEITGAKYAPTEDLLQALKIDVQDSPDAVSVRAVRPSVRRGNLGARFTVRVPRRIVLDRITSSNGRITAEDIDGPARLRTSNGAVRARNTQGALEIETSNGGVDVNNHAGAVTAHTSNGRIHVELDNPERGRPIRLESSNGGITLRMRTLNDNSIRVSTSNAAISLALPDGAGAQLRANTSNGRIHSDLPVTGTVAKNHADGKIGAGGPYLDLSTSNGSINIERL